MRNPLTWATYWCQRALLCPYIVHTGTYCVPTWYTHGGTEKAKHVHDIIMQYIITLLL